MFKGLKLAGDHIVARRFEDEITLINLETGDYFAAGGFAVDVFEGLGNPLGIDGLMAIAHGRFTGDAAVMDADIQRICEQFIAAGLVVEDAAIVPQAVVATKMMDARPAWPGVWLEAYGDMKEMLLLDPIHDVGEGRMASGAGSRLNGSPPAALVQAIFRLAEQHFSSPPVVIDSLGLRFGSHSLAVMIGDEAMRDYLVPHFVHVRGASERTPDLRIIAAIDPEGLAGIAPFVPAGDLYDGERSLVLLAGDRKASLHFSATGTPLLLCAFDARAGLGLYLAATSAAAYAIDGIRPMLEIMRWWSSGTPSLFIHAAGVSLGDVGLLIAGAANAGKSTTSLAVVGQQLRFLGDDVVLVEPGARIASIYASARLRPDMAARFAGNEQWFGNGWRDWNGKPSQVLEGYALRHLGSIATLHAVVIPRRTEHDSYAFRPISRPAALRAIGPSTLAAAAFDPVATMDKLTSLLAGVRSYEFGVGPDFSATRRAFERLAHEVSS